MIIGTKKQLDRFEEFIVDDERTVHEIVYDELGLIPREIEGFGNLFYKIMRGVIKWKWRRDDGCELNSKQPTTDKKTNPNETKNRKRCSLKIL